MPIEEIIVTGERARPTFRSDPFGRDLDALDEQERIEDALDRAEEARDEAEEEQEETTIEEIIVRAAPTAVAARPIAGLTRSEFNLGRARAASLDRAFSAMNQAAIDEITVVARRSPTFARSILPFGGGLTFGADILARIVDRIGEQRLDEAGRVATRPVPFKPDTPVATIQPEVIPEIVVTAPRPRAPVLPVPTLRPSHDRGFFDPRVDFPSQRPTAVLQTVAAPTAPPVKKPRLIDFVLPDPGASGDPRQGTGSRPLPRSTLLNIPRRVPGSPIPTTGPGNLTGFGPAVLTSVQPGGGRASNCPPCKPRKKKNRTKCYKRLVKEKTNPRNDKSFKLVEINCRSGKEIPKKRKGK